MSSCVEEYTTIVIHRLVIFTRFPFGVNVKGKVTSRPPSILTPKTMLSEGKSSRFIFIESLYVDDCGSGFPANTKLAYNRLPNKTEIACMRRQRNETSVAIYKGDKLKRIENYREFWNDSILILVIPSGNVFYAQRMSELEPKDWYNMTTDFEKIEDVFTRIEAKDMSYFKAKAYRIMEK